MKPMLLIWIFLSCFKVWKRDYFGLQPQYVAPRAMPAKPSYARVTSACLSPKTNPPHISINIWWVSIQSVCDKCLNQNTGFSLFYLRSSFLRSLVVNPLSSSGIRKRATTQANINPNVPEIVNSHKMRQVCDVISSKPASPSPA